MITLPRVTIAGKAAKRVRNFDPWVFQDELVRADGSPGGGAVVEVADERGEFLAYAFHSATSHFALRVISSDRAQSVDRDLLAGRLRQALAKRQTITGTDARRLVFSEADGLPGLIVDQYADYLVLQLRSAGMNHLRGQIIDLLKELITPAGILERSDKEFREEEGLEAVAGPVHGTVPDRIQIQEDGLRFWVDPHRGHKTGFYLDQRPTRRRLRQWVQPGARVLDTFSYTGALGIAAAAAGARVTCVEQEELWIALAKENAALNGVADRMEFIAGNAFYWLDAQAKAAARVDWLILDPPALAKTKSQALAGRQALHHLLTRGLPLLGERGTLILSICTYHLLGLMEEIVRIAATDTGTPLWVQDAWLQAEDHPWILQMPATRYLMNWRIAPGGPPAAGSTNSARSTTA